MITKNDIKLAPISRPHWSGQECRKCRWEQSIKRSGAQWGGTRVRADIPPVFGGVTAAQTAGEGGVKIPPERLIEADESDGVLTPRRYWSVRARRKRRASLDERETEDGEHVNRPPVLGGPGGAEAAGRGRAPKMLACSGLIAEKDAFVLQGDGKIAPSMDGHPADTEGRRTGRNDGRTGGTKTAGAQCPAGAAACRSGPNGGAAGMYETAITARADGQGTHEGTRSIEYG
ncbi:hypothetical protein C8R44DRAFT_945940 [Mycena epipterygia]|nr:hypothetical protein C8R44DRAFT_945940 [Mycena epipterygia]